jgi:hypothetical protein
MPVAVLTIHFQIPLCASLKEKRSQLKPVLARLHKEFNISAAEMGLHDHWRESIIACALISNDNGYAQSACQHILAFFENTFPHLTILEHHIESI